MEPTVSKRQSNKARHRQAILEAAEQLFAARGFEGTSIEAVAAQAGLTKRTLYQYFLSKEDLYFAVAVKGGRLLTVAYEQGLASGLTALDKIRHGNRMYLQFYREHPDLFRILNYKPADSQGTEASPNAAELAMLDARRMMHFASLVEQGRADGSINADLDMRKAVFFAFFSAFSLLFTASGSDKGVWNAIQLDEEEFLNFSFDRLIDALK
jgi:AcrR family transcriptional regulator